MRQMLRLVYTALFLWLILEPVFAGAEKIHGFYDLGVFAYEEGDYEKAEALFKKALSENPGNAYADYYLGRTYIKLDRLAQAEAYLMAAHRMNPDMEGLSYEMGVLYQKKGDYKSAAPLLEAAAEKNPSNVLALYHAGISLLMLKDYEKALDYLLRSARMSPTLKPNAYYYAGVCYYRLSEFDAAMEKFEYVDANAKEVSLRENARLWLKATGMGAAARKPYSLYLKLGYLYDDNVKLAPDSFSSDAIDTDTFADESDGAAMVYFSGRYDLVENEEIRSGLGYSHYQTRHNDLDAYDLTGSIGELYTDFRLGPVILGLSYVPSYYWVDTDSYLMQHQVKPEIRWRVDDNNQVDLSYHYDRNNYFTENSRDGHVNGVDIDALHGFTGLTGYMFCGLGYEDNTASSKDEYYTELAASLGLSWDVLKKTNLTISGEYYDKDYDYTDSVYKVKREDSRYLLFVGISQGIFFDWLSISAEYSYTKNNSNIADYDYERNTAALYMVADF